MNDISVGDEDRDDGERSSIQNQKNFLPQFFEKGLVCDAA